VLFAATFTKSAEEPDNGEYHSNHLRGESTMASIRPLERTLAENVNWNKARINFLAKFLIALI